MIPPEEINELIEKHLPKVSATWLQERLAKADNDASEVEHWKGEALAAYKFNDEARSQLLSQRKLSKWENDLSEREKEVSERERDHEHKREMLNVRMTAERDKVVLMQGLLETVFRNAQVRRTMMDENGVHRTVIEEDA